VLGRAVTLREDYTEQILSAFSGVIDGIFDVGLLLHKAKAELPHGVFLDMVESDLPFSTSTAERFMKIAADQRLEQMDRKQLPARWTVLHAITQLDDEQLEELKPDIKPDMKLADGKGRQVNPTITTLTFEFPEAVTYNAAISLAKKRDRRGRPTIYDSEKKKYYEHCDTLVLAKQLPAAPSTPWPRWKLLTVQFRVFNPHDPVELMAGLKWPIDWLVTRGYVADDSLREVVPPLPWPDMVIDRGNRGVTVTIQRV